MNNNIEKLKKFFSEKEGDIFSSPRALFGRGEEELFTIVSFNDESEEAILKKENEEEIAIKYSALKEAVLLLEDKSVVSIVPENITDAPQSLEEHLLIWQSAMENISLKKNEIPYIADLIVLSGIAAYGWAKTNNGDKFAAIAIKEKQRKRANEEEKKLNEKITAACKTPVLKAASEVPRGNVTKKTVPAGPVLITYSTRYGTTADIAWSIRNCFQDEGILSEVKRIQDVDDVRKYRMVIIGTPIYDNKLLPEAVEFARLHKDWLSKRMTALFVVGISLKEKEDEIILKTLKIADEIGKYITPVDIGMFAGKILPENLPIRERINAVFNKEKTGDFRNWRDIGDWADKIKKIYLQKFD